VNIYTHLQEKLLTVPFPKFLTWQLFRYLFVSIVSACVDLLSVYLVLKVPFVHYTVAVFAGFMSGTMTNFLFSNKFVFARSSSWTRTCIKHYASSGFGLLVNLLVVIALVEGASCEVMPAKGIALVVGFFVNFFAIKFFAFSDNRI